MTSLFRQAALVTLVCAATPATSQTVTMEPTIGVAEQQYFSSQADWLNSDPNLFKDLPTGNPQDLHRRIQQTKDLRDQMMQKKGVYLDLVVKQFGDLRSRIAAVTNSDLPVSQLKEGLGREQNMLLDEQERLDGVIAGIPKDDDTYALVLHELNAEREQVVTLQNSIALQIRSMAKIGSAQEVRSSAERAGAVEQKLGAIGKIWETERDQVRLQKKKWDDVYDALDRQYGGQKPVSPARASPAPPIAPVSGSKPKASLPHNSSPRFEGSWRYESQPNGWAGFAEPLNALLVLHASGKTLLGSYSARIPGRRNDVRELVLTLQGEQLTSAKAVLDWVSLVPEAKGKLTVQLGGDGRILVDRTSSTDTYIPLGMEVLLPRE